jgi:hypothetical protein
MLCSSVLGLILTCVSPKSAVHLNVLQMGRPEVQAGSVTSLARRKMSNPVAKSSGFSLWSLALVVIYQLTSVKAA